MSKALLSLALAAFVVGLVGCGGGEPKPKSPGAAIGDAIKDGKEQAKEVKKEVDKAVKDNK
ncbi:MAG TPA: hypothetical protein VGP72_25160 [Planctomycetota bacterium]